MYVIVIVPLVLSLYMYAFLSSVIPLLVYFVMYLCLAFVHSFWFVSSGVSFVIYFYMYSFRYVLSGVFLYVFVTYLVIPCCSLLIDFVIASCINVVIYFFISHLVGSAKPLNLIFCWFLGFVVCCFFCFLMACAHA